MVKALKNCFNGNTRKEAIINSENSECFCSVNGVNVHADCGRDAADFHTMQETVSLLILHSTEDAMKKRKLLCEQTIQHNTNPNHNYPN